LKTSKGSQLTKHNARHTYHAQKTHTKPAKPKGTSRDPSSISAESLQALKKAITLEHIPESEFSDLAWIMAHESGGIVDAKTPPFDCARAVSIIEGPV